MKYKSFPGGPNEPTLHQNPEKQFWRAKGVVILDTGHHLKSHPPDIKILDKYKNVKVFKVCFKNHTPVKTGKCH